MEEIVYRLVSLDGMVSVKLVSDREISPERMMRFVTGPCRDYANVNCYPTSALSLFYGEVTFPLRGALELTAEGWRKPKRFAVWKLMKEDGFRVSEVIEFISQWYFVQTKRRPSYAFMKSLPQNAECGMEIDDVMLMQADWALDGCVMVGG